jgi:Sushi repeat (SCR repeat)
VAGSRCILECAPGYLPQDGELAVCQASGQWSPARRIGCVRPIAMLIGGYNAEEVGRTNTIEIDLFSTTVLPF